MDAEIMPAPTESQRRALLAALRLAQETKASAYASRWRRAGLPAPQPPAPPRAPSQTQTPRP